MEVVSGDNWNYKTCIRDFLLMRYINLRLLTYLLTYLQSSSQIVTTDKPPPNFLQAGCPSCHPTNSIKAPAAQSGSANDEGFSFCLISLVVWKLHQVRPGAIKGLQRRTFGIAEAGSLYRLDAIPVTQQGVSDH